MVLKRESLRWPCFAETSQHLGIFRARFTLSEGLIAAFSVMGKGRRVTKLLSRLGADDSTLRPAEAGFG